MKKNEVFDMIKEKLSVTQEELDKEYQKAYGDMKERGVADDALEEYALMRLQAYYKKQLRSVASVFEGVKVCETNVTDFGAQKKYDAASSLLTLLSAAISTNICLNVFFILLFLPKFIEHNY